MGRLTHGDRVVELGWLDRLLTSPSGVGCVYGLLDELAGRHRLDDAVLVVVDPELGRQAFRIGRRPIEEGWAVDVALDGEPGLHVPPDAVSGPDPSEREATLTCARIALSMDVLRHRSQTDPLTGLLDRGGFDEQLHAAVDRATRYGRSFTLALLDLDGFKAVNDRLGHAVGDEVLRRVGQVLRRLSRGGDIVGRVGGDEFALVLPETTPTESERLVERIRGQLARGEPSVDLSAGLVSCPDGGDDTTSLLRAADARLYENKRTVAR